MTHVPKVPKIITLGTLTSLVHENGKNNDDGDGWTIKAGDELRPPRSLPRGPFVLIKRRRS